MSFYLQPHTQPASSIQRVTHLRFAKLTNHSALKNAFLGDVQLSRPGQWLEEWKMTSQNNGVYPVAAARSKLLPQWATALLSPWCHGGAVLPAHRTSFYPPTDIHFWEASLFYTEDSNFQSIFCSAYKTSSPNSMWGSKLHCTLIT